MNYRLSGPEAYQAYLTRLMNRGLGFYSASFRADVLAMRYLRMYGALPIKSAYSHSAGEPATLKMFVWRNILVDYTGGIAIALAKNVRQAREVILRDAGDYGRSFLSADIAKPPDEVYESPHGIHVSGGG